MAKRKKSTDNTALEVFDNEVLSAVINDKSEAERIESCLKSMDIAYTVGDVPIMQEEKVIGCSKQITVLDGKKLKELL